MPSNKPMDADTLAAWETSRDMAAELEQSIHEMLTGKTTPVRLAPHAMAAMAPIKATRLQAGMTQNSFAKLLGVSISTLRAWEQGRRVPSTAAQTLLQHATLHPELLQQHKN